MISPERLTDLFVEVADTLVADFDLIDFLHNLTDHAAAISGADAVGLMLADHHGALRFMAASNENGEMLDLLQLQNSEGPCLDCFTTGEPVLSADLTMAGDHWPLFAPAAGAAGFRSVQAVPMRMHSPSSFRAPSTAASWWSRRREHSPSWTASRPTRPSSCCGPAPGRRSSALPTWPSRCWRRSSNVGDQRGWRRTLSERPPRQGLGVTPVSPRG